MYSYLWAVAAGNGQFGQLLAETTNERDEHTSARVCGRIFTHFYWNLISKEARRIGRQEPVGRPWRTACLAPIHGLLAEGFFASADASILALNGILFNKYFHWLRSAKLK
jgi:hypothetical protein